MALKYPASSGEIVEEILFLEKESATFDLTGLPPSLPEIDEFLEDERPNEADDVAVYALGTEDRASVRVLVIDDEASVQ